MTSPQHLRWTAAAALTALTAGVLRARRRLHALPVLPPHTASPGLPTGPPEALGWQLISARGVHVDDATRRAALQYAERENLQVLDLIPGDLGAEQALGLLRLVDPAGYRGDRLAPGRGAGCAVLVTDDVCKRAGLDPHTRPGTAELLHLAHRVKQYAPAATDLAIAPGLRAPALSPQLRAAELRAQGLPPRPTAAAQLAGLGMLALSAAACPPWGTAAAALYWLQPYLVLGPGSPLHPADLAPATAARPLRSLTSALRTAAHPQHAAKADSPAAPRSRYAAELAAGTDRFFEPRRTDCPWCGCAQLAVRVRVPDLLQGKPGRFTLEQCRSCGHIFQNPRLTPGGLDFYYRDFYDGLGAAGSGHVFGRLGGSYLDRAELLRPYATPTAWLDVGTGHGHFCNAARAVWPGTRFDGLDMGDGVREAERRGWVSTGYQGQFPEYAHRLAGQYDTVSMYHYLEHTRDPFAELDAAATVLTPGGHLLIELPDPASRMAHLLGPHWLPWFQPQHQHLIPAANLRQALYERGFTLLTEQHGPAHQHNDFVGAVALTANRLAPDPAAPWATRPDTPARRAARHAVRAAALASYAPAAALDALRTAVARRTDGGNAYRLLARKERGASI
ncbi:class I SAM-dependent methyltransferase [Streptomyces gobiensis]|uniref:class I SAM-dependent methyltransferase n=1 Tax=Streptomyces gobiensis TaxID=2875706 RepID=UPI001E4AD570|nr:class I SAM-dependent methyltransferase [Streptomyces gobiensis]UGY94919.1 class I SAM-dependent methyltransferase [Streptomyces gobiensis]